MRSFHAVVVGLFLLAALEIAIVRANYAADVTCMFGPQNLFFWNNGDNCGLQLTGATGSGFKTWNQYQFGVITMAIQLVPGNSAGTVTTYYMSSSDSPQLGDTHDEIDYEFLGNVSGQPYTIHTNLFAYGKGEKEIQFRPWFDPTGYNNYTIFWNQCMVVWYINWVPIRVFKNFNDPAIPFPYQPMKAFSSIWNGDSWATQGGRIKIDWNYAPFTASYQGLTLDGCPSYNTDCYSSNYWYNNKCSLTDKEMTDFLNIWNNYKIYDYCEDYARFDGQMPPECYKPRY